MRNKTREEVRVITEEKYLNLKPEIVNREDFLENEGKLLVRFDKQLCEANSRFHLSVDEFYLYFLCNADERKNGVIKTNLSSLRSKAVLRSGVKTIDLCKIVETLYTLSEKGIVEISDELITFKDGKPIFFDENSFFYIKIKHSYLKESHEGKKWLGFMQIPYSILTKVTRVEHLYIYCTISRYNDSYKNGFECSYSHWSKILGRSSRTVKRHIQELVDLKVIFVNIGDYQTNSRIKQKVNIYRTSEFEKHEKTIATKNKEHLKQNIKDKASEKIAFGVEKGEEMPF